jgi:excinuclease ABC subunit C
LSTTTLTATLKDKLSRLPREPGCYLMKDAKGTIIYVGKARSLKSRVSSYFGATGQQTLKTRFLVREIYDFDVIITQTEVESLLLERTLIKHHSPKFNINLRDDKEYPYLRINFEEDWPRIDKVRRRKDDGATYLGPFGSAGQLKVLLDAVYRIFPLIRCSRHEFQTVKRPCNYYHMKMCLGPCTLPVQQHVYKDMMRDAVDFLSGRNRDLLRTLKAKMQAAAEAENYEMAALVRDQLKAFENVTERQAVVVGDVFDADVLGFAQNETRASFHVLQVREGKVVANDGFVLLSPVQDPPEALVEFMLQYYDGRSLPHEVLLPFALEEADDLRTALLGSHPDAGKLALKTPERGPRHDLVDMATKNAAFRLDEVERSGERRRVELEVLRDKLKLRRQPRRMECIDISNIQGTAIVASNVCFVDGKPAKELYRHYVIKEVQGAPDDFASIREVVGRRLERARRDGDLPDLLVIDGGKGQLSSAVEAAKAYPDLDFDLVSLAKSRVDKRGRRGAFIESSAPERSYERVFFPDQELPTPLSPGTPEFRLLTQIRDEAHRFAITHHRKRRAKISHGSALEDIPGIGPTIRKKLLETFGGLDGLRAAPLDKLREVKGLRDSAAVALYSYLHSESEDEVDESGVDGVAVEEPQETERDTETSRS